ncbi:hypothetical protein [Celeribacter ethanolicus]|uniref:hypothetical protein n=1 Tax=Celeribacter ethanolicus TaxID=1758178 RepID=UPI000832AFD4|nr:hypothetical protein [Celeribacter ethanolicus]
MTMRFLALAGTLLLSGCIPSGPKRVDLSMTSFSYSPVLITQADIADVYREPIPTVRFGMADIEAPRSTETMSLTRPLSGTDEFQITAQWVELLTNRAWQASVTVDPRELTTIRDDRVDLILIFGANGHLVIGSDDDSKHINKDVAETCGLRVPEADRDVAAEANAHAKLASALAFEYPPVPTDAPCPEPAQ